MKRVLFCLVAALLLTIATTGLGFLGLYLDPWDGQFGGNNPLILLGAPLIVCVLVLSQLHLSVWLPWAVGAFVQFFLCLLFTALVMVIAPVFRRKVDRARPRGR